LDTGGPVTVLSPEIVDKYRLKGTDIMRKISDINEQVRILHGFQLKSMLFGKTEISNMLVFETGDLPEKNGKKCHGIIGCDLMRNFNWVFLIKPGKVIYSDKPYPWHKVSFNPDSFYVDHRDHVPKIDIMVNNVLVNDVVIDCGSANVLTLPDSFLYENVDSFDLERAMKFRGDLQNGLFGYVHTEAIRVPDVEVKTGDVSLERTVLFNNLNLKTLGNDILDDYVIILDFKNNYYAFVDLPQIEKDIIEPKISEMGRYGFSLRIDSNNKMKVDIIYDNSPASKAGIEYSDEVIAINGEEFNPVIDTFPKWYANHIKKPQIMLKIKDKGVIILKHSDSFK
jgi:hypothetical protein